MLVTILTLDLIARISAVVFHSFKENVYACFFLPLLALLDATLGPYTFLLMSDKFKKELVKTLPSVVRCLVCRSEGNLVRTQSDEKTQPVVTIGISAIEPMN